MMSLTLALYAEGNSDDRFLTHIVQRTSKRILAEYRQSNVGVAPVVPITLFEKAPTREESILRAAKQATGYQALIVHSDADHPSYEKALNERILPGLRQIRVSQEKVCRQVLPIIPVQAIEAWILVDSETLCAEIRTNLSPRELGIPEKARQVEAISKPKQRLNEAIAKVNKQLRPHQRINVNILYESLGRGVRLERLKQLDAYRRFEQDLIGTFVALKLIPDTQRRS